MREYLAIAGHDDSQVSLAYSCDIQKTAEEHPSSSSPFEFETTSPELRRMALTDLLAFTNIDTESSDVGFLARLSRSESMYSTTWALPMADREQCLIQNARVLWQRHADDNRKAMVTYFFHLQRAYPKLQ